MFLLSVCKALNDAKLLYTIVGGYAVALHGAPRGTVDLDLVIALNETSFLRLEETVQKLGLESRLPISAKQLFQFRTEYIVNRNLIAWSFYDPKKPSNQLDIIITADAKKFKTKTMTIHGIKVRVASIPDLIKMKEKANRSQDKEDVKALRELLKYEKD